MSVYLITGASGYIGSMLGMHLLKNRTDSQVLAVTRSGKVQERWRDLPTDRMQIIRADLGGPGAFDTQSVASICTQINHIDYILHCASITDSAQMVARPVETFQSIVNTTQSILELARRYRIRSMVCLSSMEVYGSLDCPDGHRMTEEEAGRGNVDLLQVRSCYPLGKRMAENLCRSYFEEYGVPVKIARLSQTFGRGTLPSDRRVFAQFARAVKAGKDIVLHTEGRSMGNYCGIEDTIFGILTILEKGQDGEAYNVVNEENTMTIRQMAELVAEQIGGGRIKVTYAIPQEGRYGYAADTGLRLSGEKLRRLGWKPEKKLVDMYRDMLG